MSRLQAPTRGPGGAPAGAIRLTSHAELAAFADGFARGRHRLLITLGPPGTGKSHAFGSALAGTPHRVLSGHVTPLGLYRACYEHRDRPIVLDDVDALVSDPVNRRLLKALLESAPVRRVSWCSGGPAGGRGGALPTEFETRSPVAVIANDWPSLNANVRALEDRGIVLVFDPPPGEVHRHVATWFTDREVLAFIGAYLPLLPRLSMRAYLRGSELRSTTPNWRPLLLESLGLDPGQRLLLEIARDDAFASERERVREFVKRGGGSRARYYRIKRRMGSRTPEAA